MPETSRTNFLSGLTVARQHAEAGHFGDFLGLCRQLGKALPDDSDAQLDLGVLLAGYGFFSDARSCYERARSCQPTDQRALVNLANLARDASEHGTARGLYNELLHQLSDHPVIRRNA